MTMSTETQTKRPPPPIVERGDPLGERVPGLLACEQRQHLQGSECRHPSSFVKTGVDYITARQSGYYGGAADMRSGRYGGCGPDASFFESKAA